MPNSRRHRDVLGSSFIVQFEIVDRSHHSPHTRYEVVISIGGTLELLSKTYSQSGVYTEVVPSPQHRGAGVVIVRMKNHHGQLYEDSFSLSFNVHFYKTLKWIVFVPFAATAIVVLTIVKPKGSQ